MAFNTGDRVRCIRDIPGHARFGVVNEVYEVVRPGGLLSFWTTINDEPRHIRADRFVLVQEPVAQQNASTFYTLIYKTRNTSKRCMGFETQEEFNNKKREVLANGGTVFGEKKLKLSNVG